MQLFTKPTYDFCLHIEIVQSCIMHSLNCLMLSSNALFNSFEVTIFFKYINSQHNGKDASLNGVSFNIIDNYMWII